MELTRITDQPRHTPHKGRSPLRDLVGPGAYCCNSSSWHCDSGFVKRCVDSINPVTEGHAATACIKRNRVVSFKGVDLWKGLDLKGDLEQKRAICRQAEEKHDREKWVVSIWLIPWGLGSIAVSNFLEYK